MSRAEEAAIIAAAQRLTAMWEAADKARHYRIVDKHRTPTRRELLDAQNELARAVAAARG